MTEHAEIVLLMFFFIYYEVSMYYTLMFSVLVKLASLGSLKYLMCFTIKVKKQLL